MEKTKGEQEMSKYEYLWICPVRKRQVWASTHDTPLCVHTEEELAYKMEGCYEPSGVDGPAGLRIRRKKNEFASEKG